MTRLVLIGDTIITSLVQGGKRHYPCHESPSPSPSPRDVDVNVNVGFGTDTGSSIILGECESLFILAASYDDATDLLSTASAPPAPESEPTCVTNGMFFFLSNSKRA